METKTSLLRSLTMLIMMVEKRHQTIRLPQAKLMVIKVVAR